MPVELVPYGAQREPLGCLRMQVLLTTIQELDAGQVTVCGLMHDHHRGDVRLGLPSFLGGGGA